MVPSPAPAAEHHDSPVLEIRTYALVPGSGPDFHELMLTGSVPLLRNAGIEVVHHGVAIQDPDRYILVRAFASEDRRQEALRAFYGSDEWLTNWDDKIIAMILEYHVVALDCPPGLLDTLRQYA